MNDSIQTSKRSPEKRFSLSIKNIDINTHRAYKLALNDHEEAKKILKNPYEILKNNNQMRCAFGLTDQRFRWQNSKNLGENMELTGSMVKRLNKDDFNKSLNKNVAVGSWESLIQKTDTGERQRNRSARDDQRLKIDHIKTKRTIIPQLNSVSDEIQIKSGKKKPPLAVSSKATGSIANLIEQTPMNDKKYKKLADKLTEGNDIFKPGFEKIKISKKKLDIPRSSKDPLNISTQNEDGNKSNSISRSKKLEGLGSNIFSYRKDENDIKERRNRVSSVDENNDAYKKNRSQIVF